MIEAIGLSKRYEEGASQVEALSCVDLAVEDGEFLAVIGPSGSGKSTLMNLLGCLDVPSAGKYLLERRDVTRLSSNALAKVRAEKIGFVFQGFNLLPRLTAIENVSLPLVYLGVSGPERSKRAAEALERVGLLNRLYHRPMELSGGQQQRVAVARALIANPSLILADEPTGNLDSASGEEIMALFHALHRQGRTIVLITHDPAIARQAQRRVSIRDGRLYHSI